MDPKESFLEFSKNLVFFCGRNVKQTCAKLISGKIYFLSYRTKCGRPIILQGYLIINISGRFTASLIISDADIHQAKVASQTTLFGCVCLGIPSQTQTWLDFIRGTLVGLGT